MGWLLFYAVAKDVNVGDEYRFGLLAARGTLHIYCRYQLILGVHTLCSCSVPPTGMVLT